MVLFKNKFAVLSIALSTMLYSPLVQAGNYLPDVHILGDISYITGGIGVEETKAMESERSDYNLQIMNSDSTGHFDGTRNILISDENGNELLDVNGGPLFYASLPKGRYLVQGSSKDQVKKQKINVSGNKPAIIHFVWK